MIKSRLFSAFLDGVNIASVAIILTVCISFGRETISDWRTILIAVLSLLVTFSFQKMNTVFVILGSAVINFAFLPVQICKVKWKFELLMAFAGILIKHFGLILQPLKGQLTKAVLLMVAREEKAY